MPFEVYNGDVYVCDGCAFSFPKEFKDSGGGYSCPVCEEQRLRTMIEELTRTGGDAMKIQINAQTQDGVWGYLISVWDDAKCVASRWLRELPPMPSESEET